MVTLPTASPRFSIINMVAYIFRGKCVSIPTFRSGIHRYLHSFGSCLGTVTPIEILDVRYYF
jgi:hypothetical protein